MDPITQQVKEVSFDFPKVDDDIRFRYSLDIETYLPRNKSRLSMIANMFLETQAQYKPDPEIRTVEDWLLMQDIPFKDMIFKRMGIQRIHDATTKFTKGLFDYASLVANGTDPNEAVGMVGENIAAVDKGADEPYEIPSVGGLIQNAPDQMEGEPMVDPMQSMQQDPMAMLQQSARTPGAQQGLEIDPEILAALGNIQ